MLFQINRLNEELRNDPTTIGKEKSLFLLALAEWEPTQHIPGVGIYFAAIGAVGPFRGGVDTGSSDSCCLRR